METCLSNLYLKFKSSFYKEAVLVVAFSVFIKHFQRPLTCLDMSHSLTACGLSAEPVLQMRPIVCDCVKPRVKLGAGAEVSGPGLLQPQRQQQQV